MLKIGITGGIGSGKSTACHIFKILGIPVFNSDEVAKQVMMEDMNLIQALQANFGSSVYRIKEEFDQKQYLLNRKYLADLVFKDSDKLKILNSLVHPAVFRAFDLWLMELKKNQVQNKPGIPFIIREAALMFETKSNLDNDYTVLVYSKKDIRIDRIKKRDGLTDTQIQERMGNQWLEEDKMKLSDYIIYNDSYHSLLKQIIELHREWVNK